MRVDLQNLRPNKFEFFYCRGFAFDAAARLSVKTFKSCCVRSVGGVPVGEAGDKVFLFRRRFLFFFPSRCREGALGGADNFPSIVVELLVFWLDPSVLANCVLEGPFRAASWPIPFKGWGWWDDLKFLT